MCCIACRFRFIFGCDNKVVVCAILLSDLPSFAAETSYTPPVSQHSCTCYICVSIQHHTMLIVNVYIFIKYLRIIICSNFSCVSHAMSESYIDTTSK